MSRPHTEHVQASRIGGLESWANTPDRTTRTASARAASPSSVDYWLTKLDPERFAHATDRQRLDAAESMRRAYFARLAMKSAAVRKRPS